MDPAELWDEHIRQNTGDFADDGITWAAEHIRYLERKCRELTYAHDWMTKKAVAEQGRAQQAEARLRNAVALLLEWGRSVTGFDPAPYQQTADWLRTLPKALAMEDKQ